MYSSHTYLKRKTPEPGINRQEFISHLIEEYYTTTNVEAQEQVSANLANFAYDPINWDYLKSAEALKLFVELLQTPNEKLQLYGTAGLCNICLDKQSHDFILEKSHLKCIQTLLVKTENLEITLNILTLIYQLLTSLDAGYDKAFILTIEILKKIKFYCQSIKDQRIINISTLILEDFAQRHEFIELKDVATTNTPPAAAYPEVKVIKRFTQNELDQFSQLTGDKNIVHSSSLPIEERRVHGAFLNAIVAGIIGTKFPGPGTIVLEQRFAFLEPCRVETDTEIYIRLLKARKISLVSYECIQNQRVIFQGEAKLLLTAINK
uniref:MaoC-like domain-containing protein n=1 Tax=Glossina austeni TaxID=7395 RepID=A0A1A9VD36_GLOAU